VQNQSFPVTLTKGGSWALLRKSAVELTTLAQPFCVNQAVGGLRRHFHFMGEFSKLDRVKTMGTHGKINAIWWTTKCVYSSSRPPTGTSLHKSASFKLSTVKIRWGVWPVGELTESVTDTHTQVNLYSVHA